LRHLKEFVELGSEIAGKPNGRPRDFKPLPSTRRALDEKSEGQRRETLVEASRPRHRGGMSATRIVTIASPEGSLEGRLDVGARRDGCALLLCHPHPQYGGSMDDDVLGTVADALVARSASMLRFNFRGVGASTGRYDGGRGEIEDVEAAARHLAALDPSRALWLCGYSFGSWMAWSALRSLEPERVILIAPPVGALDYPRRPALNARVDVIAGAADQFVDREALDAWSRDAAPCVVLHEIEGADHFFGGRYAELARIAAAL
jgi:alpha/beta superfamily hydrolase